jgi:ABC-type phosphate transport system substrate-binding protein
VRTHRTLSMILAGAMLAAGTVFIGGAALADPISPKTKKAVLPAYYDVVGVGSDTDDALLDALSFDFDGAHKTHNKTHPWIYSWDATPPNNPLSTTSSIRPKSGCSIIARPDGSGAGIAAFENVSKTKGHYCLDFARSASYRPSSDPDPLGKNLYVALAEDAETYAVNANSNAPASLTIAQLNQIYSCTVPDTNWSSLGGKDAPIDAYAPSSSSGVGKFWLQVLGLKTFGPCVITVQQNQGISSQFEPTKTTTNPDAIVPYSVGKYIAQRFHSAQPGKKPGKNQNLFGADEHGHLVLGEVAGIAATVGSGAATKINTKLEKDDGVNLTRPLYDVLWYAKGNASSDHDGIPTSLEQFFAPARGVKVKGWFCANKTAQKAIVSYGFLTTPECGFGA